MLSTTVTYHHGIAGVLVLLTWCCPKKGKKHFLRPRKEKGHKKLPPLEVFWLIKFSRQALSSLFGPSNFFPCYHIIASQLAVQIASLSIWLLLQLYYHLNIPEICPLFTANFTTSLKFFRRKEVKILRSVWVNKWLIIF